jgi:hypothetical protein
MKTARRFRFYLIAINTLIGLGIFAYFGLGNPSPKRPIELVEKDHPLHHLSWPMGHSWIWEFDIPGKKEKLGLSIRTVEHDTPLGEVPVSLPHQVIPPENPGTDWSVAFYRFRDDRFRGHFACQVIDFSEIDCEELLNGKPLRIILHYHSGGSTRYVIGKKENFPMGTRYVGFRRDNSTDWIDEEYHLFTLYTQGDRKFYEHYFVLKQLDQ